MSHAAWNYFRSQVRSNDTWAETAAYLAALTYFCERDLEMRPFLGT